jgi:lipopolysaccharide export system permease protein
VVAWVLPKAAEAQVPAVAHPPSLPAITPGAGYGEEARVQGARQRAATYEVEIQKKLTIATACIVFALLGIPVALRFPRGGVGLVIGTSVVVFAIYYIGLIGGEDLGDRLILSPFLAMWTPNLIFSIVGLVGLWVVRSEGSPARGGDWSDVRELLVGWLRPEKQRPA